MTISRRELLKRSVVGAAALSSVSSLTSNSWVKAFAGQENQNVKSDNPGIGTSRDNPVDCLILGAGIAGITAAQALSLPGVGSAPKGKPLTTMILEGSGRIGGRISTIRNGLFGGPVEQGAVHLHLPKLPIFRIFGGVLPVWKDLEECGLHYEMVPRFLQSRVFLEKGGKDSQNSGAVTYLEAVLKDPKNWKTVPLLNEVKYYNNDDDDISAQGFIEKKEYEDDAKDMANLALSGHLPGSLDELSVRGLQSDLLPDMLLEWFDYRILEGFDELPGRMAAKISEKSEGSHQVIRLNQIVRNIKYRKDGVEVTVQDLNNFHGYSEVPAVANKNASYKTYYGKTAICTFSVGLIKSGFVAFDPGLSEEKRKALKVIQMGGVSQMHIRFVEKFWPDEVFIINYPGKNREAGRTYFNQYFTDRKNKKPPVLIAYLNGVDDMKMRGLSDKEALGRICNDLRKVFSKDCNYLKPDLVRGFHRKQWIDDPFALGGFSYLKYLRSSPVPVEEARQIYAAPDGALFWAGEATVLKKTLLQPSSVPGAHNTGLVAAQEVRKFLGKG